MNILIGIVIIVIAGIAVSVFEAVGGWPGVFAIIGAIALGKVVISTMVKRSRTAAELRRIPSEIDTIGRTTNRILDTIPESLRQATQEFEASRAPLFWDHIEECCYRIFICTDLLDRCARTAKRYNREASGFNLTPRSIPTDDPELRQLVEFSAHAVKQAFDAALTDPVCAIVFEQRRQGQELKAQQQTMHEAMQAELADVADTARDAAAAARSARWAAKRASGDWF